MHQLKLAVSGAQILFVAFGALVLVPLLTGLNPAMALLGAGVGTLLFQLITKQQVPVFWARHLPSSPPSSTPTKLGAWVPPCSACFAPVSCILSSP